MTTKTKNINFIRTPREGIVLGELKSMNGECVLAIKRHGTSIIENIAIDELVVMLLKAKNECEALEISPTTQMSYTGTI